MLVEFSGANAYRCFWTPPVVVILGGLHINLLLDSPGGRAHWHNEYRSPNSSPRDLWAQRRVRAPMHERQPWNDFLLA